MTRIAERYARGAYSVFIRNRFGSAFPSPFRALITDSALKAHGASHRALAANPRILLMDEPFGALDAHTRILLQKELLRIWSASRKTVIFVTHSVDEAVYLADRIVVMSARPGKIIEEIDIRIKRPRRRDDPRWGVLATRILALLDEATANGGLSEEATG